MTEIEFKTITGKEPIQDDLERANCPNAGKIGHQQCGICSKCKWPIFMYNRECNHFDELLQQIAYYGEDKEKQHDASN